MLVLVVTFVLDCCLSFGCAMWYRQVGQWGGFPSFPLIRGHSVCTRRGEIPSHGNTVSDIFIFPTHLIFLLLFSLLSWWKYEIQMKENFGAIHSNLKFNCLDEFLNMQYLHFFGRNMIELDVVVKFFLESN